MLKLVGEGRAVRLDLNGVNHCEQRFDNAANFEAARVAFCRGMVEKLRTVEDAITGNELDMVAQTIN
eukprot:3805182-Prymnesium_polylepis.1